MAEYQRVAALGLRNLASSFDLRALAAKVGALEAVTKMLRSRNVETARYAAKAASELSLHEVRGGRRAARSQGLWNPELFCKPHNPEP
jgi:hypothetical protein